MKEGNPEKKMGAWAHKARSLTRVDAFVTPGVAAVQRDAPRGGWNTIE
jgi:hypothetical protein